MAGGQPFSRPKKLKVDLTCRSKEMTMPPIGGVLIFESKVDPECPSEENHNALPYRPLTEIDVSPIDAFLK